MASDSVLSRPPLALRPAKAGRRVAASMSSVRRAAAVEAGSRLRCSAAAPATIGAAKEVPE